MIGRNIIKVFEDTETDELTVGQIIKGLSRLKSLKFWTSQKNFGELVWSSLMELVDNEVVERVDKKYGPEFDFKSARFRIL